MHARTELRAESFASKLRTAAVPRHIRARKGRVVVEGKQKCLHAGNARVAAGPIRTRVTAKHALATAHNHNSRPFAVAPRVECRTGKAVRGRVVARLKRVKVECRQLSRQRNVLRGGQNRRAVKRRVDGTADWVAAPTVDVAFHDCQVASRANSSSYVCACVCV